MEASHTACKDVSFDEILDLTASCCFLNLSISKVSCVSGDFLLSSRNVFCLINVEAHACTLSDAKPNNIYQV